MTDYFAAVERELRQATARRASLRLWNRYLGPSARAATRARIVLAALALVLGTTAVTLAASGVILNGSPVRPLNRPSATAGQGIPLLGGSRLLPLRAADPAGGLPWGMRIVHTTRGLICVQLGRVDHGQLGRLGVDGAFGNDGRFHPLPAEVLPDLQGTEGWGSGQCTSPSSTYAGDIVGLQLNAANNPRAGTGPVADRREISYGLLGKHAVSITYRLGSETRTERVLPGLGAFLIVQRYTSGRQLGSSSSSVGRDEPGNYSAPAAPNGALTSITYDYGGKPCVSKGSGPRLASCGLSETPPPPPAALPVVHPRLSVRLHIHRHVITGADLSFRAPYPVTSADQSYSVSAWTCQGLSGSGSDADVAPGGTVHIPLGGLLSVAGACSRSLAGKVEYIRFINGLPQPTPIGTVKIRVATGAHARPLPLPRGPR
jgi:hypothetical protein